MSLRCRSARSNTRPRIDGRFLSHRKSSEHGPLGAASAPGRYSCTTRNRPTSKSDIAIDSCGDVVRFAQDGAKKAGESNHWENSRLMKAAFVLVLTALPVALPLGGAFAAPAVTANVDVLVGSAQINDAASDLIAVVAAEIDVTVGANNKNIEQGIVNVAKAAAPVTCTTVAF